MGIYFTSLEVEHDFYRKDVKPVASSPGFQMSSVSVRSQCETAASVPAHSLSRFH